MADVVEWISDVLVNVIEFFPGTERPRRFVGILFLGIALLLIVGTSIAYLTETKVSPVGLYFIVPGIVLSLSVAAYCFLTDQER